MKTKTVLSALLCLTMFLPGAMASAQEDTATKLLAQSGNGVLTLVCYDKDKKEIARGAAVVLSENTAVTTYHLVSMAANVVGFNAKKKEVDVDGILAIDKSLDIVLLQVDGKVQAMPLGGAALAVDLPVVAVGSNAVGDLTAVEGKIRKLFELSPSVKVADSTMVVGDEFDGGAVLDSTGNVSGILNVYERRLRFIVPVSAVTALPAGTLVKFKDRTPEDYKESVEGGWLSGRMFFWIDEAYASVRGLERVTKAQPANVEAWKTLAGVFERQRDYSKAIGAYEKLTALDPQNAEAYAGLGQIQAKTIRTAEEVDNQNKAIQNLEKALQLNPSLVACYLALGSVYDIRRDWVKAGDSYDKYLASNPADRLQVYKFLGNVRREAEQFEAAAAAYGEAVKLSPEDAYLNYQLSQMLEKAKKYEEAEAAFLKTGEIAKEPAKYFPNIISMYDTANLSDKMIAACKKWIELVPQNEQAYYSLGMQYQKMQKNAEAIEAYKKAVEIKPTFDYAWFQIGYCRYALKEYTQAIPAFEKNVQLVPDNVYGWMYIGMCHMQVKQFKQALEAMKKAVELKPDNADALFNLGVIHLNLKDKASALEIVKTLQTLDPAKAAKLKSYIK